MANNDILIQEERWQNIDQASPGINYTIFDSFGTANGTINAQRIACVNGNGSRYHMTVAFSDGNTIESWTNYTGASPLKQDINDGSAGSLDLINGAPNTRPVVTYDESGNYITIAWNYNNSNSTYGAGYHPGVSIPIAVLMNAGGSIGSTDYLDVPRTIDTQERAISICSRWSGQSQIGVAWFDNSTSKEIFYKVVSSPPSDFRTTMNSPIKLMSDELRVYDLQGKLLKVTVEKVHNVNDFLRSLNLQRGVYIINGLESTTAQNQMYFVQ
jgi:hypothetical protein